MEAAKVKKLIMKRWVALVGISYLLIAFPLSAGAPTDQVQATVEKVLAILQDPRLKSEAKRKERRDQLRQAIYARFDFTEMAKRSLGSHWRQRSPKERREFVEIFTGLVEDAYVDKIESYNGEKLVITRENQDKDYAEVNTKIVTKKGEEYSFNYRLHLTNGNWKVYDVVIENISLVNNYRSQFNRTIANSSYEELVRRMKEKNS
jgi:phospholipid transport system substrate-binding protein